MHKDDMGVDNRQKPEYVKHSRNSKLGKAGHNRTVRRKTKTAIKAEKDELLRKTRA